MWIFVNCKLMSLCWKSCALCTYCRKDEAKVNCEVEIITPCFPFNSENFLNTKIFDSSFLFSTNNLPVSGLYLWHQLRIALECGSISWTHLSKIKSGCDEGFSANPLEIGNTGLESLSGQQGRLFLQRAIFQEEIHGKVEKGVTNVTI